MNFHSPNCGKGFLAEGLCSMNSLTTNGKLTEMECGANFAVILKDNAFFLPTEYKVLQSQKDGCFVKCMRMLYNGKTELYYFAGELKSLSSLLSTIDAERFLTVLCKLLGAIINVQSNGFLTCRNIDASFERIYIDPNTYKVNLVYLPLKENLFDDDTAFENEIRTSLVKLIAGLAALSTPKMMQVSAGLQNGSLNMENLYAKLSGKVAPVQNGSGTQQGNSAASGCRLKFVAMNAPARFEIVVNKSVFMIGKKDTNDGVITFNKMISRVHCKITSSRGQYWITDLQSSNGTFINHARLQPNQPYELKNGDIVRLANSDFQAVID